MVDDWDLMTDRPALIDRLKAMLVGEFTSTAVAVLALPLVTRLFPPPVFGVFAVFLSVVNTIEPLIGLNYHIAIPLAKEEKEAFSLVGLNSAVCLAEGVLALAVVYLVYSVVGAGRPLSMSYSLAALLPLALVVFGLQTGLLMLALRQGSFRQMALARVAQPLAARVLQLAAGLAGLVKPHFLALGHILGYTAAAVVLRPDRAGRAGLVGSVDLQGLRAAAGNYRSYPLLVTPAEAINALGRNLPVVVLAYLYGPAVAGYFALGQRVIGQPLRIVIESVTAVFYHQALKLGDDPRQLGRFSSTTLYYLVILISFPLGLLFLYSDYLVPLVFGREWLPAGAYVGVLAFYYLFFPLTRPLGRLFDILRLQTERLVFNLVFFAASAAALAGGALTGDPFKAVAVFSVSILALGLASMVWFMRLAGGRAVEAVVLLAKALAPTAVYVAVSLAANRFFVNTTLRAIVWMAVSGAAYYLIVLLRDPGLREAVRLALKSRA